MKKIFSYIMQQKTAVLLIFLLLIVQAFCELALPQYTSNIVNVGIGANGIETSMPECIRESQLMVLENFIFDEDLKSVQENYKKIDMESLTEKERKNYKKKYPSAETEILYEWKGNKEITKEVEPAFVKSVMLVSALAQKNKDLAAVMSAPAESRKAMLEEMNKQLKDVNESMLSKIGTKYAVTEYKAIGADLEARQNKYILTAGGKMLGLSLLAMLVTVIVSCLASKAAGKIGRNLRSMVFEKVVSFTSAEFDKFSTASLITRSTNDIQQLQMVIVLLLRMVLYAPILGIGGVLKVLDTNTSMSWIIVIAVAAIVVVVVLLFAVVMPKFKMMQTLMDRLNLVTREILTGMPVIRAFSTERYEEKRFDKANTDLTKTMLFTTRMMSIMFPTMMVIINFTSVAIIWFGSHAVENSTLQIGDMIAFITYSMQIVMSFLMITMISIFLPRAGVSANRVDEILQAKSSIFDPENPVEPMSEKKGFVEFKNVSFKYPGADGYTLKNISFTAKPGQTTAFIGSTGSGKSTLVNLVPRFYDVTEGAVLIDGVDVRQMKQAVLRDKLGFVPQKAVLFSGTIESNIKYGKEDADMEAVKRAARIAQSADFIEGKENQYESVIAQGGTNVSGGQKQRLSIARAIAKEPEIFVFDDSFSALDFKTDAALRKALHEELRDSTILLVAQRISTIVNADQIIVLDEGEIAGKGTHEELLKNCDVYYEIASSQLSASELAGYARN
ncbi:ABC transporter ATP-binding protein [[Clostridium] polysaccharolyticum]|uniref:ATP-binding cassette, subfamily B n=1 Tax=[Clostridium] polysaccharolyticum TaxID=29364 RepID=A0A1H9YAA8_9FIRM|nr:ABC transporter ATP-binding protein [[Clostridium] polysaccharolyticum]SES65785.1 ATP-binding cassette, subfamily B [[Clostridium] polysaccharolyticum]